MGQTLDFSIFHVFGHQNFKKVSGLQNFKKFGSQQGGPLRFEIFEETPPLRVRKRTLKFAVTFKPLVGFG